MSRTHCLNPHIKAAICIFLVALFGFSQGALADKSGSSITQEKPTTAKRKVKKKKLRKVKKASSTSSKKEPKTVRPFLLSFWPPGSTLDLGLRVANSALQVKLESDKSLQGEMRNIALPAPALVLASPFKTWFNSGFGYKFKFGFSWFTIKSQKVDGELVDLGTSADGYSIYLTPTIGYTFGTRKFVNGIGKSLLLGVGLGGGYLISNGKIQLTEVGAGDEIRDFDFNQFTYAALFIVEARVNRWSFEIQVGGPSLVDEDLRFEFLDTSIQVARTFTTNDFTTKAASSWRRQSPRKKISLFAGGRQIPVLSNEGYLVDNEKFVSGAGAEIYYSPRQWPLGLTADVAYYAAAPQSTVTSIFPQGDDLSVTLEAQLIESHFGIKVLRNFNKETFMGSLGGGLAMFHTQVEGQIDGADVSDDSVDFGYWLGGGLQYKWGDKWSSTLQMRFVSVQTDLLGVFEEGSSSSLRLSVDYLL